MTSLKITAVLLLCLVSFNTWATDDTQVSVDIHNTLQHMNQTKSDLTVESEVADLDREEYEAAEKQASNEISKMRADIREMERKSNSITKSAERARMKAEVAAKKLALSQREQAETQRKLSLAEKEKSKVDHRNSQLKAKMDMVKLQLNDVKAKNRATQNDIRKAEKENLQLKRTLEKTKKMIALEKRKKDNLRVKRLRLSQEKSRIKNQINRIAKSN